MLPSESKSCSYTLTLGSRFNSEPHLPEELWCNLLNNRLTCFVVSWLPTITTARLKWSDVLETRIQSFVFDFQLWLSNVNMQNMIHLTSMLLCRCTINLFAYTKALYTMHSCEAVQFSICTLSALTFWPHKEREAECGHVLWLISHAIATAWPN